MSFWRCKVASDKGEKVERRKKRRGGKRRRGKEEVGKGRIDFRFENKKKRTFDLERNAKEQERVNLSVTMPMAL